MRLLGGEGVVVPRGQYDRCSGKTVIHCACIVPKSTKEANDAHAAALSATLVYDLLGARPRFVVLVSTRATDSDYARGKRAAEIICEQSDIDTRIVRFPGLFGPPKKSGLVYNAVRAALTGDLFMPNYPLPHWYGMHVEEAARLCIELARAEEPGLTTASNPQLEEFLDWVRS